MQTNLQLRPARAHDAEAIVRIIQSGFSQETLALTIYGCRGIAEFVRYQLLVPRSLSSVQYLIAQIGTEMVGCVELRHDRDDLFLNYISIFSQYRGEGLGTELLRSSLNAFRSEGLSSMSLDVFDYNSSARSWYERLGFEHLSSAGWWVMPPRATAGEAEATMAGVPQAEAAHGQFGFSQVTVRTPRADYAVGRLGTALFRLTRVEAVRDPHLVGALACLDSQRDVLVIDELKYANELTLLGGRHLTTTHRLRADITTLRERLGS